jgi:hypothetical protein
MYRVFRVVSDRQPNHKRKCLNLTPPFSFSITFLQSLLDQHKTSFIKIADILPFSANITKETLIASTRLLVYTLCSMLADFLLI